MATHKLVVADTDRTLRNDLAHELAADGYTVVCSPSERALTTAIAVECPDLVILGDFDGPGAAPRLLAEIRCGELCDPPYRGPVIVLTRAGGELALLRCFEAGADEFIDKPASYLELRARLRAVLLRTAGERTPRQLRVGELAVDLDNHRARWAGAPLALSGTEFSLLAELAADPARLRTKDELLKKVWGLCRRRHKPHYADLRVMPIGSRWAASEAVIGAVGRHNGRGGVERSDQDRAPDGAEGSAVLKAWLVLEGDPTERRPLRRPRHISRWAPHNRRWGHYQLGSRDMFVCRHYLPARRVTPSRSRSA